MLRELAEALEVLTTEQPFILWLEDLHWSDVSTLDFLALLARRKEMARLLVVGTYRPVEVASDGHPLKSHVQELVGHQLCAEFALGPLGETDIEEYLAARFAVGAHGRAPLQTLARTLHHRIGGNPLFLVSLVDDLVARGILTHTQEGWTLRNEADAVAVGIPETIRQLVARQRERLLPEEQHVLEAASVAGMEFSAAAVAAALAMDTAPVERHCEQLAERQQFLRQVGIEKWPDGTVAARYGFLHALYQQLWHERVSPTQLQYHHRQIGERKERAYGDKAQEIAPELAVHFEQGREYRKAVRYLQQAGQRAVRRSANVEAVAHLTKGLELLKTLPDTPERNQQELTLQIALGASLMVTKGYAAPEVEQAYTRARELCQQISEAPQLFPALWGLWIFYANRTEYKTARELGEQLLSLAQSGHDPALLLEAHTVLGITLFLLGEMVPAGGHLEQGIALYDPQQHRSHAFLYEQDPRVNCLSFATFALWLLGYPDAALKRIHEARAFAQELSHPFSLVFALTCALYLYRFRREAQAVRERAEAVFTLSTEQGFPLPWGTGTIHQGWALAAQGQGGEGIAQIRQGLAVWRATGAELWWSYFLGMLAEAHEKGGEAEEGLRVLAEALAMADKSGERFWEAELYRLKGELTLAQSSGQGLASSVQKEAEECFRKAVAIARRQSAKSLELRAVMSLSRLWQQQGKKEEARQMLAEIYGWFTEGFDTADLKEAKALLEELS
jgi:predicted ATPase